MERIACNERETEKITVNPRVLTHAARDIESLREKEREYAYIYVMMPCQPQRMPTYRVGSRCSGPTADSHLTAPLDAQAGEPFCR
jgi:hypothetical protein